MALAPVHQPRGKVGLYFPGRMTQTPAMPPRPPEAFATERLIARIPCAGDAPEVFAAYASDPEVTRYLAWRHYTDPELLRTFLAGVARTWSEEEGRHYAWLLSRRDAPGVIGSIGVNFDAHRAMLGYVLARSCWGQGLMVEAVRYVSAWALAQPALYRVWAFCDVENTASARVLEKAGFAPEGRLRRWHVCPTLGPEPRDCLVYARVR